ncbi:radical SAM/SPASM domain-containing protein [Desulfobacca acetoxidans]|uniref:Radical SAM domain protein n=1 Tax=Desulfobacca acetoxidans (strain ATCC 700848 / DSM 11109 / ASRB2) TaxID=880072 RepID=F2NJ47_DESAR|nr:radical SAM protein [Desulfobacca acetoxidans]AEB08005.1 Radical SAM domain protein [Desulfobacca acetoxidans DSM 11109]
METVHISITNACNLRCKHCFTNAGTPTPNELTLNEYDVLFRDLYKMGVFQLVIAGGEPFIRPDVWKIMDLAEALDFCLFIETNTMLLRDEDIKRLKSFTISQMHIPLEGMRETNDYIRGREHFAHTLETVRKLSAEDIPVEIRTTASKRSIDELEELALLLADTGVNTLFVSEFTPTGRGMSYAPELLLGLELKKKLHDTLGELRSKYYDRITVDGDACGFFDGHERRMGFSKDERSAFCAAMNGESCVILPNGTVSPCDQYAFHGGNIRFQSIREIIEKSPVFNWFREFPRSAVSGTCGACKFNARCGGCRIFAFLFNGDIYSEDPMCWRVLEARGTESPLYV